MLAKLEITSTGRQETSSGSQGVFLDFLFCRVGFFVVVEIPKEEETQWSLLFAWICCRFSCRCVLCGKRSLRHLVKISTPLQKWILHQPYPLKFVEAALKFWSCLPCSSFVLRLVIAVPLSQMSFLQQFYLTVTRVHSLPFTCLIASP